MARPSSPGVFERKEFGLKTTANCKKHTYLDHPVPKSCAENPSAWKEIPLLIRWQRWRKANKPGILRALMAMENQTQPLKASLLDHFGHILDTGAFLLARCGCSCHDGTLFYGSFRIFRWRDYEDSAIGGCGDGTPRDLAQLWK
jgi:hypothetical protein